MIFGLIGYSGSGKTTVGKMLAGLENFALISTGDFVRSTLIQRSLPITAQRIAKISDEIRRAHNGVFMAAITPEIQKFLRSKKIVVVDCLREQADIVELRRIDKKVVTLAIVLDEQYRLDRLLNRKRDGDPRQITDAEMLKIKEMHMDIANLITCADYVIKNQGNLNELILNARNFIQKTLNSDRGNES
jgi:dephospho-CoA kinase